MVARARTAAVLALASWMLGVTSGCGGGHGPASAPDAGPVEPGAPDASAASDAMAPDAARPLPPEPVCGNGVLEAGESCDDEGVAPGDGCAPDCRWEARCGDGTAQAERGEACDDGGHASGDGCRSDCASDERCGNGVVDTAAGELCDDGDPTLCAADCRSLPSCGDGVLDAGRGETCDDANVARWDGCGPDCRSEVAFVLTSLAVAGAREGCDESGDGAPDHALARALGGAREVLNALVADELAAGSSVQLLLPLGLDDPSGQDDASFTLGLLHAHDADGDPSDHASGHAELWAPRDAIDADGRATYALPASVRAGTVEAGPGDVGLELPLGAIVLRTSLVAARLRARVDELDGHASAVRDALLCGALSLPSLAAVDPNPLSLAPGVGVLPGCDDEELPTRFIDSVVGGTVVFGIRVPGAQPDVDLDGDGLETYVLDRDGREGCSPAVVACIDGDGTRIDGRDCVTDPRMADGMSATVRLEAAAARVVDQR